MAVREARSVSISEYVAGVIDCRKCQAKSVSISECVAGDGVIGLGVIQGH